MIHIRTIAVAVLVLTGSLGCTPVDQPDLSKPVSQWRVELVRPDGVTFKTWIVRSRFEPRVYAERSGHSTLYRNNGDGDYKSFDMIAPVGWLFLCTEMGPDRMRDPS